jgi:rRNA maturation RNase YbeY
MISISNRQRARKVDLAWLKNITAAALAELKIQHSELGIVLVGAKEMASLNEKFLGHGGATDVITFDYLEPVQGRDAALRRQRRNSVVGRSNAKVPPAIRAETSQRDVPTTIHGEIFICVPEAERQAKLFGTDRRSEVVRYVVHGILHLLGHDDLQALARKIMKREEDRLVREVSRRFALSKL